MIFGVFQYPVIGVTLVLCNGKTGGGNCPKQKGPIPGNTGSLVNGSLTFNGWNTAANGLGTAYPVSSNGFTMPAANVILYAQWV